MKKELVLGYQLPGIPGLFHETFSDCEQHHKALQEEKKLPGPEQFGWIGLLFPGTPEEHSTVLTTGPSNSVNPISVCTYHDACSFISENAARQ